MPDPFGCAAAPACAFLWAFGLFLPLYVVTTANQRQLVLTIYKDATYPRDYAVLLGDLRGRLGAVLHRRNPGDQLAVRAPDGQVCAGSQPRGGGHRHPAG